MFKIEIEDGHGVWSDVRSASGDILTFEKEDEARAKLAELYPVIVQMEQYEGGKTPACRPCIRHGCGMEER